MQKLLDVFLIVLVLAVLGCVAEMTWELHRAAVAVEASGAHLEAVMTKAGTVLDHVDQTVLTAPATLEKAVSNAINPLPVMPSVSVPTLSTLFKQSTPAPKRP